MTVQDKIAMLEDLLEVEEGALKPETGQAFRDKILSRGNTGDLMQMFTDFTGMTQPDASAILRARGL